MVASSSLAWRLPATTKASVKVIGGLIGLIAGIGLLAALVSRVRAEFGAAVTGVSFLVVFVGYVIGWVAVSLLLPRASSDPGVLLPGALLVGATLTGMQIVSQVYLPDKIGRASHLYGAVGTTIVTLGWFFIAGRAIVIAMCLDAVIHERFGTISRLVFSMPVLRLLARKSAWIRRFFSLDDRDGEPGGGEDGRGDGVDTRDPGLPGADDESGDDQPSLRGHPGRGAHDEGERG
jgi:Virulence factor BrkB